MKSANSGTPHSYLEVKGLHRLGDAVVGRRRDAVAADALQEAHRVSRGRGSLGDREATGARRKGTPGAAPRPGAASGGPAVPLSTRARWPRRVWLPGTSYAVLRDRCGADAQVGANRAGVCDMGVQARGLLPARAGRRGPRKGLRAAKRRLEKEKPGGRFHRGT